MRKIKYIAIVVIVILISFNALEPWIKDMRENMRRDQLVQTYQKRFDKLKTRIYLTLEVLPPPKMKTLLHKSKLADAHDTRIAIVDFKALKESIEVYQARVADPFAARLHYWQPDSLNNQPSKSRLINVWPTSKRGDKLAKAYEYFLDNVPRYLAIIRPIIWKEPDASQKPIKAGFVDLEIFVLDVKKVEVLASTRLNYNQAKQRGVFHDISTEVQSQAERDLRKSVDWRIHEWLTSLFAADQKVKIGSLLYDFEGQLKEPKKTKMWW